MGDGRGDEDEDDPADDDDRDEHQETAADREAFEVFAPLDTQVVGGVAESVGEDVAGTDVGRREDPVELRCSGFRRTECETLEGITGRGPVVDSVEGVGQFHGDGPVAVASQALDGDQEGGAGAEVDGEDVGSGERWRRRRLCRGSSRASRRGPREAGGSRRPCCSRPGGGSWVELAAREADGWIASAAHNDDAVLADALARYRDAGGRRAIVTNVRVERELAPAVERLQRLRELGFDDCVALVVRPNEERPAVLLEQVRSSS